MLLERRIVFVTGAGRGIGRGIAEAAAEAGADVGIGDRDLEGARETARLVEARGRRGLGLQLDVTDAASVEAALGINVNAVCPGGVDTPMLAEVARWLGGRLGVDPGELVGQMKPRPMARHVRPIEVGRVVAFLLSDHAAIIRGQAINVDGGDTPY